MSPATYEFLTSFKNLPFRRKRCCDVVSELTVKDKRKGNVKRGTNPQHVVSIGNLVSKKIVCCVGGNYTETLKYIINYKVNKVN